MNLIPIWVVFIFFFLLIHAESSIDKKVKNSLFNFYSKLSNTNSPPDPAWGWNLSSDPCLDNWRGVICDNRNLSVKRINLGRLNFTGTFDPSTLCSEQSLAESLTVIHLDRNSLRGENLDEIADCRNLTHLYIGGNQFSGTLPESLSRLSNLKVLDISGNSFSGTLPDLTRISGLQELFAQNNQLTGPIPKFEFSNFDQFNVSFNSFTGPIPDGARPLPDTSFIGNPELCGEPLPKQCSSPESNPKKKSKDSKKFLMYGGYLLIGLVIIVFTILKLCKRRKTKEGMVDAVNKVPSFDDSSYKPSIIQSVEYKAGPSKSEVSADSGMASASLIVLTSPEVNGLKFDDLLKAPAELLGRGKHGTVYKVICEQGVPLAVKRIRDWAISSNDFKQRMRRLDQVKHPNVLPAIAFYCSKYEKLLIYEYQENGSLFKLLHGTKKAGAFDWSGRLGVAVSLSQTLSFMHQELHEEGIAHGNLKSSNILLNKNMEPIISEYGLMMIDNENQSIFADFNSREGGASSGFKSDIYGLGVILLELLTGKLVQNDGLDLASWVLAVVREEWTVEVFDRSLIQEGASEERMVNLLRIAVKCVDNSPEARPSIHQVALVINSIKEEEERSTVSEP